MASMQIGNIHNLPARGGKGQNGGSADDAGFFNANLGNLAAKKARLTAINGTLYTAQMLNTMTHNDLDYAIRVLDNPATI